MEAITKKDLELINSLSKREYKDNTLLSNASEEEKQYLTKIRNKLKILTEYFAHKYNSSYGPFETSVSSGNPLAIGGKRLNRVWSGMFKGTSNKQYSAQISFVMNPSEICLDVGFCFGRASGHSHGKKKRYELENALKSLGMSLSEAITTNSDMKEKYNSLFDFGFSTYSNGKAVLPDEWYNIIKVDTKNSQIIAKIYPDDFDIIENSSIDFFVSQIIFLMSAIKQTSTNKISNIIPLTPEQQAKRAERLAQIGLKGELFIMNSEKIKLEQAGITDTHYPKHVALESMNFGYDIVSIDENEDEIFIEVKTTTRKKEDINSKIFFMSSNEFDTYLRNKKSYKLYRVYDIENEPSYEEIDLEFVNKRPDGFIVEYKNPSH